MSEPISLEQLKARIAALEFVVVTNLLQFETHKKALFDGKAFAEGKRQHWVDCAKALQGDDHEAAKRRISTTPIRKRCKTSATCS